MPKSTTLLLTLAIAACASVPRGADTTAEPMSRQQLQGMLTAWKADNLDAHIWRRDGVTWRIIHDHSS